MSFRRQLGQVRPANTEVAAVTIPAGKRALINHISASLVRASGAAGSGTLYLQAIPASGARRTIKVFEIGSSGPIDFFIDGGFLIQEKTDLVFRCSNVSDNNTLIQASIEYLLVSI